MITLAHGGGGLLSRRLIAEEILPRFPALGSLADAASLTLNSTALCFTTDSFVVQPLVFPGGNIGHLAVHGTVNDLAVSGSRPCWLSLAMILEEGLPMATLRLVLDAVRDSAAACGVTVVTGDTKVVRRGQCDGLYLNSAGIGVALAGFVLNAASLRPGDCVLTSGPLAQHGLAVLCAREGLAVGEALVSDSGPVHRLVLAVDELAPQVRFMRDPTRGGAAAVLTEIVTGREVGITLHESALPITPACRMVADMLGFDPLHIASEGCLLLVADAAVAPAILQRWRALPEGREAAVIGSVTTDFPGRVILETSVGGKRIVDLPHGELLPRIC